MALATALSALVVAALDRHEIALLVALGGAAVLLAGRELLAGALRARTEEFRRLTDLMPVGVFRVSADGKWLYTNRRFAEILGVAAGSPEAMGKAWETAAHPEERARVRARDHAPATEGNERPDLEYRLLRPDGDVRWIVLRTARFFADDGRPRGFQGIVNDVTERRLADLAMAASEALYRGLATSMPVGVARRDKDGRLSFVNRELLEIAGLAPATPVAELSASLFHPDDREAVIAAMEHTLRTGDPYAREVRVLRPDGDVRFVNLRGSLHLDANGDFAGYLSTMADITERRTAERAVRLEVEHQRALMAAVPTGIVHMDAAGVWVYANDRFRELWHMTPQQDPAGVAWIAGLHPDDRERVVHDWSEAMDEDGVYEGEFRIMAPDGSSRWTWTRAVSEYDATGERTGFLAAALDVHERRSAEEALSRSERLHRLTINNVPGVVIGLYDRDLRCLLMEGEATSEQLNTAVCAGRTLAEFGNPETAELLEPGMRDALFNGREQSYAYHSPRDGSYRENHVGPLRSAEGEIEGVVIVSRDVTEYRLAEDARRTADEQFRVAFEQAPIGIVDVTLDGRFSRVNQAVCEMTGYSADELLGMAPLAIIDVADVAAVRTRLADVLDAHDTAAIEHRITHAAGHAVWVDTRVALIRGEHGEPVHMLAQIQDISDRRHYEHRLEHMADHDPLTGLLNRRGLERELDAQLARVRRYDCGGTLAVLDLDGFKSVNDTLGHAAGDKLIIGVSDMLRRRLRETDVIARMGGDEFAVILPSESGEDAAIVARALLESVRELAGSPGRQTGPVTASIGLAAFDGNLTADQMLVLADRAMYNAKETGKDRYATADAVAGGPGITAVAAVPDRR